MNAATSEGRLELVLRRTPNVQYWLEHHDGLFFLRIRDPKRPNCVIVSAPVNEPTYQTVLTQSTYFQSLCLLGVSSA